MCLQSVIKPELQEAISDYATSKEKDEYPDDFESDEDGMLNGIGKESNSGSTSTGRSVAGSPVLNDDALQKAVDLEKEAADDLSLSFHEKKLQQIMVLEDQDQKTVSTSDLKLEDNDRKSPSVDSSDGMMKITEEQKIADTMQEVSVNDQSEHGEAKNTSKNSVKKLSEIKERVLQNPKASLSDRSTTSVHLKRKGKAVPSTSPVSSQYLGSVKVLEDKCVQKKSPEFNKVDDLRAAVYQNWLEKKKLLLLELKRSEKEKAEILRSNTEKKEALKREESIACYEAWKKKKDKEARKLNEKKKLEELEEKKPAEQNKEKTEAAQAAFKKWKERKVEYLKEQSRKEKQSEKVRKKIEEDLVAEKRRVSVSAVEKWNEKKEEYIKKKKVEKFLEKRKREMQQAKKEEKSEKAMEEYERWLENKMRTEQLEKYQKKLQAVHGNEMSPPWRPPGKVTYSTLFVTESSAVSTSAGRSSAIDTNTKNHNGSSPFSSRACTMSTCFQQKGQATSCVTGQNWAQREGSALSPHTKTSSSLASQETLASSLGIASPRVAPGCTLNRQCDFNACPEAAQHCVLLQGKHTTASGTCMAAALLPPGLSCLLPS
ncbi:microtubule-associated protein 9 isoform X4 [Passer domesticus]|uniref:microtubule-associated protein 9 isoform X4 n=1 Tax=Passer domesticus TaxID=48849 RepID=UPI0030FEDD3A